MGWEIVLFCSTEKITSVENLDPDKLVEVNFCSIFENHFTNIVKHDNHRSIKGKDFSIDYFVDEEPISNKILSLYGENGLYEIIKLAKESNWQIFDTGLGTMLDLDDPAKNGYTNFQEYLKLVLKK
jgi:hypothetical protein